MNILSYKFEYTTAHEPNPACCLFLSLKFSWNTAVLIPACIVCGCFYSIEAELGSYDRHYMANKKLWLFVEKIAKPCFRTLVTMDCLTYLYSDSPGNFWTNSAYGHNSFSQTFIEFYARHISRCWRHQERMVNTTHKVSVLRKLSFEYRGDR